MIFQEKQGFMAENEKPSVSQKETEGRYVEPTLGFEPRTCALRKRCSTPEPSWRLNQSGETVYTESRCDARKKAPPFREEPFHSTPAILRKGWRILLPPHFQGRHRLCYRLICASREPFSRALSWLEPFSRQASSPRASRRAFSPRQASRLLRTVYNLSFEPGRTFCR